MMTSSDVETHRFEAETAQLLHLVIHSLYPTKDLFLRELLSNASDALDKLRFEGMLQPSLLDGDPELGIRLETDAAARTLTVADNGIGMSRDELIAHIGTIARSGTREFVARTRTAESPALLAELIGEFGVGFYSAFMVAHRVRLVTRRAGETQATEWISTGDGTYTLRETEKPGRGTTITLDLRDADTAAGLADYTNYWTLAMLVSRYSGYIGHPIRACKPPDDPSDDRAAAEASSDATPDAPNGPWTTLNAMKPLWKRPPSEVREEEYHELYRRLSDDWTPPLKTIHFHAEGTLEYDALLFVPSAGRPDLYYVAPEWGVRLLVRRVTITERSTDLLPRYLRFVRGLVDCADLSLDVSRLQLRNAQQLAQIRKRLTRKVLDVLEELLRDDRDRYVQMWREFGRAIKEGVASDSDHKERLLGLTLWETSHAAHTWTTLAEYVSRMPADQTQILYATGESREVLDQAPHLEALRDRGYEALFMTSPVDELLLQYVPQFDGKPLKSVGKGQLALGTAEADASATVAAEHAGLTAFLQTQLAGHVKQVRPSTRLTRSPVCLVVDEHDYSPMLERALRHDHAPAQRRVLEINPAHPIVQALRARHAARPDEPGLRDAADMLFGLALLAEGSSLPEPVGFTRAAMAMLLRAMEPPSAEGGAS